MPTAVATLYSYISVSINNVDNVCCACVAGRTQLSNPDGPGRAASAADILRRYRVLQ